MKFIMTKHIVLSILILAGLSSYSFAESNIVLPKSTQITQNGNETNSSESIEIVAEIVIQAGDVSKKTNPALKEGEACDDVTLEPAIVGPDDYRDIPMAQTISCDEVDCKNLDAAVLLKDTHKKMPMAKTQKIIPCDKK